MLGGFADVMAQFISCARCVPSGGVDHATRIPEPGRPRMIRMRNPQDLLGGAFLILIAILAYVFADNLPIGRLVNMGPGYVPRVLSWALGILGVIVGLRGFTIDGPALDSWAWRPLAALTASVVVFAVLLERAGLVIAILLASIPFLIATILVMALR